ncbi:hypothetical protein N8Z18_00475 [bacterium]|jgi:hypothetical protein|nr:hypothetical protein [bacterium]
MRSFKEHINEQRLDERIIRKGAVAAYASSGKRHGDDAVKQYQQAKRLLSANLQNKDAEQKIDIIINAMLSLSDGLILNRRQIGSVSAQVTALSLL